MIRTIGEVSSFQTIVFYSFVFLIFFLAGEGRAEQGHPLSVVVDYVIDGDSLMVKRNGKAMEVRLWGIDAPEYDQPYSAGSKKALKKMTVGQEGTLFVKYRDRYDRYVAVLVIGELNINQELVIDGHSWVYGRYCNEPVCGRWEQKQSEAKANRRGLWSGSDPVPPWQWKARR
ncbi:MAG: thermonuclease family protein [Desulfofustis sp.]|nr:thermonuclease family protein [Desulfofustis sp.]